MTKPVRRILFLSSVVFIIGIIIAYYNTASLGYDNANIISFNKEGIYLFDMSIYYSDIHYFISILKKFIPKYNITI